MSNEEIKRYALLLLKTRPRGIKELESRLRQKGFPKESIDEVIEDFRAKGLLDDLKFSRLYAASKIDLKSQGLRSIDFQLKKKGIDEEIVNKAIEDIKQDYNEYDAIKEFITSRLNRYNRLDKITRKRRLYSLLVRRGFDNSSIWKAFEELGIK